jgi:hypothetical protein
MSDNTISPNATGLAGLSGSVETAPEGVVGLSPDMILAYCGQQMRNLNDQIDTLVNQQNVQIKEQKTLADLQSTLGQYDPPKAEDMPAITAAYDKAIAELPQGSEAQVTLQGQLKGLESSCHMTSTGTAAPLPAGTIGIPAVIPPDSTSWASTTGAVGDLSSNIKSDAQLQFLQLQDLCSQQQSAVEQATNMMSKEDQTLLDQAKAL